MAMTASPPAIEESLITNDTSSSDDTESLWSFPSAVTIKQKLIAELVGTYFLMITGFGAVVVDKIYGQVTFPGICMTWGLAVAALSYTLRHVSGAHFNPAVTITFAIFRGFPLQEVPLYVTAQLLGSILAGITLALAFDVTSSAFYGTVPTGSHVQSLVIEFIITALLLFVIFGACTDDRAIAQTGGLAVGMTVAVNSFVFGKVSGASMNPARSIGAAVVEHVYDGLWIYIVGPISGGITGGFAYDLLRLAKKQPFVLPERNSLAWSKAQYVR